MPAYPGDTNEYRSNKADKLQVRTACKCGWKTRWRTVKGRPPRLTVFRPFLCPKCGNKLSDFTIYPS